MVPGADLNTQSLYSELREINSKLDRLIYLESVVHKHEEEIYGNGDEGLNVRVDRLEQSSKSHKYYLGLLVALMGVFAEIWRRFV